MDKGKTNCFGKKLTLPRFNTISALCGKMKIEVIEIKPKEYEESIVDKSGYTPLEVQLSTLKPMSPNEIQQHYDFIDGHDDGRAPRHKPDTDIAVISTEVREKQKAIKNKIDKAQSEVLKQAEHQQMIQNTLDNLS